MTLTEEDGGVRVESMIEHALENEPRDLRGLMSSRELVAMRMPAHAAASPAQGTRAAVKAPQETAQDSRLMPLAIDEAAGRIQVGFLHLRWPGLPAFSADKQRHPEAVRRQWQSLLPKERTPILLAREQTLGQSIRTAKELLSLRADCPLLVGVGGTAPFDETYRRLGQVPRVFRSSTTVQWLALPLYQFGPAAAGWRSVATAAEVPPGLGVVAIGESGPAAEALIARLGLLGRLAGKQLVLTADTPDQLASATLLRLLAAGLVDAVIVTSSGSPRPQLLRALADGVARDEPLASALVGVTPEDPPVMIIGGT